MRYGWQPASSCFHFIEHHVVSLLFLLRLIYVLSFVILGFCYNVILFFMTVGPDRCAVWRAEIRV